MNYVLLGRFFLLEGLRFVFLVGGDEKRTVGERRGATPRRTLLVRLKGQPKKQNTLSWKRGVRAQLSPSSPLVVIKF